MRRAPQIAAWRGRGTPLPLGLVALGLLLSGGCKPAITGLRVTLCQLPAGTARVDVSLTSSSGVTLVRGYPVDDPQTQLDLIATAPADRYRLVISAVGRDEETLG